MPRARHQQPTPSSRDVASETNSKALSTSPKREPNPRNRKEPKGIRGRQRKELQKRKSRQSSNSRAREFGEENTALVKHSKQELHHVSSSQATNNRSQSQPRQTKATASVGIATIQTLQSKTTGVELLDSSAIASNCGRIKVRRSLSLEEGGAVEKSYYSLPKNDAGMSKQSIAVEKNPYDDREDGYKKGRSRSRCRASRDRISCQSKSSEKESRPKGKTCECLKEGEKLLRRTQSNKKVHAHIKRNNGPLRRTQSYESISTSSINANGILNDQEWSHEGQKYQGRKDASLSVPISVDERGLPTTSVGSPPVASLDSTPPSTTELEAILDAQVAEALQEEECIFLENETSRDCDLGDDRKMPAILSSTASANKKAANRYRRSLGEPAQNLVLLSPEDKDNRLDQEFKRKRCVLASDFVKGINRIIRDFSLRLPRAPKERVPLHMVLTKTEILDLVIAMFQTQSEFRSLNKPVFVDLGYHYCRRNNIRRIQQQPGLWTQIQAKGVSRSQDGNDGIFTFNVPFLSTRNEGSSDDVWMVVARLKGTQSHFNKSSRSLRRRWENGVDSLQGKDGLSNEENVVLLKAPNQFFPLFYFPVAFLGESRAGADDEDCSRDDFEFLKLLQVKVQHILDEIFNAELNGARPSRLLTVPDAQAGQQAEHQQCKMGSDDSHPVACKRVKTKRQKALTKSAKQDYNPVAWEASRQIYSCVEEHAISASEIDVGLELEAFLVEPAVSLEEMALLVNNMFCKQKEFNELKKPTFVDIGYHYCRGQNLKKTQQTPGFWVRIQAAGYNRSQDGDGVYTFDHPLCGNRMNRGGFHDLRQSFGDVGDVWLLVARILGKPAHSSSTAVMDTSRQWIDNSDSMIVGGSQSPDVAVLRKSSQFLPLLQFRATAIHALSDKHKEVMQQELQMIHQRLQGIINFFFNDDLSQSRAMRGCEELLRLKQISRGNDVLEYIAPDEIDVKKSIHNTSQLIYKVLSSKRKAANDDCSICLDPLRCANSEPVVRLQKCRHEFHQSCLHEALGHFDLCPVCNQSLAPSVPKFCLQGLSPSGTMTVSVSPDTFCQGCWAPNGALVVSYSLPAGLQKEYHEFPGAPFASASWTAYLPCNRAGLRLLRRLQYAFLNGLLFTIESSVSEASATYAQIGWASIPHMTRPTPSVTAPERQRSFPDPTYFDRCNQALDRLGVPSVDDCEKLLAMRKDKQPKSSMATIELASCRKLLGRLKKHEHGWIFYKAFPCLEGKLDRAMDLTTVERKLGRREYGNSDEFSRDVHFIFDNAISHHSKDNPVHFMANQLKAKFRKEFAEIFTKAQKRTL